ncbi:hypothetical protein DACRYDRAFT_116734 [Dacryopinax primogenitus]|uniref:ER transporter 6TM N-terminal domain-containing protein n=1 Tax=Dacryopinax primogenitus (strain DJM 731) TaxID=1858805 RepID=M5FYR0_DACPD|nr:uncharacterized protein DACRYDRAFT_116734 [Dacryopinax primogenitus]EJU01649.1 hypothetical protein DACRYDRAFT_116734 [Dacryopinax primogenitus]
MATPAPPSPDPSKPSPSPSTPPKVPFLDRYLPDYLAHALRSPRSWKTFARCLVVFIVMMVLLVDEVSLRAMGQAGFFGLILSVMLPPNMAVGLFIMASFTLLLGMLLGWAWGCAAMAASLASRSQTLLASQYTTAQSLLVPNVAPDAQYQAFVFLGLFLDPGASAVFGVFFFFGTFALALMRAYVPRFTLVAIFGTIVLDVMCSYGPLFPSEQYTLASLFLLPTSIYVAVALCSILLIFPESMNHVWLSTLTDQILSPGLTILTCQSHLLSLRPSDPSWSQTRTSTGLLGRKMIESAQQLLGQTGMAELEVSRGRLGPGDLKVLAGKLMGLGSRTLGMMSFGFLVDEVTKSDPNSGDANGQEHDTSSSEPQPEPKQEASTTLQVPRPNPNPKSRSKRTSPNTSLPGTGAVTPLSAARFDALRAKVMRREKDHGHDLDNLVPLLLDASGELLAACERALKGRIDWLTYVNSTRWRGSKSLKEEEAMYDSGKLEAEAVRTALAGLRSDTRMRILEPFERFFDPATGELLPELKRSASERMFATHSLFLCFVFGTTLKAYAEILLDFTDATLELQRKRMRNRIWFPSGFGRIGRRIFARQGTEGTGLEIGVSPVVASTEEEDTTEEVNSVADTEEEDEDEELIRVPKPAPRDPDSSPPRTFLGRTYVRLTSVFRWFMRPQALFALRYSIVSICFFAFAVHPITVYFNYANRGLWALIMAQTGLGVYAGEQIASFIIRLSGTILGLLLGMVAWYIGAARGDGNPYGIVIMTSAIIAPLIFIRVTGPPQSVVIWLMTGTMIVFAVGYSWVDSHIPVLQNAGVGVFLAWRRAFLVIIGFACAFVVMVIPYPTSARQVVRKTLAGTMEELGTLLSVELDACIQSTHDTQTHWTKMKDKGIKIIGSRILKISQQLQSILPSMGAAKFEPTFKGPWPAEKYEKLFRAQWTVMQSIALLNAAMSNLDISWLHTLIHKTPFFNPNFMQDVNATIYIVARSLRHGYPVPASLTPLRERLIYHDRHATILGGREHVQSEVLSEELDASPGRVEGASIGLRSMTLSTLKDEQLVFHSTAIVGLAQLIRTVDEITDIVRELCGTTQVYPGIDVMRDEYLGMEEAAIRRMEKR